MFGMSFTEIIVIAFVAIVFLGPDKLPQAMVNIAKFFKAFKKTVDDARTTFEQEVRISELKDDAKKYKEKLEKTTDDIRKKLTFEELDELKNGVKEIKDSVNESLNDIKNEIGQIPDLKQEKPKISTDDAHKDA